MGTDPLRDALAQALYDLYGPCPSAKHPTDVVLATVAEHRERVLAALGLEQVGWWIEDKHKHEPFRGAVVFGEFRFTEEEDGCPLNGSPVYTYHLETTDE